MAKKKKVSLTKESVLEDYLLSKRSLTHSQKLLLGIYAMQNTNNILYEGIYENLSSVDEDFKGGSTYKSLCALDYLVRGSYNFIFHEIMYTINPLLMSKVLTWLYDTDEGHEYLIIISKYFKFVELDQTPVQAAICDYIHSGYKDSTMAHKIFSSDASYLIPVVDDERFAGLFTDLTEVCFLEVLKIYLHRLYSEGVRGKAEMLLKLANSRKFKTVTCKESVFAILNLYAFLSDGIIPEVKIKSPLIEVHILNAMISAYRGDYAQAMKNFKNAHTLYKTFSTNKSSGLALPYSIANFYYVVCCKRTEQNGGDKLLNNYLVTYERYHFPDMTIGYCLAAALTNRKGYVNYLRTEMSELDYLSKQIMVLIVQFLGRNDILTDEAMTKYKPEWLCLAMEYDRYDSMTAEDRKTAEKAFCNNPLLTSMHIKQQWEYVLERLSGAGAAKSDETKQQNRLAYVMRSITDNVCDVRMQSVLKSGAWSAGKSVPHSTFLALSDETMTKGDMRIRDKEKYTPGYSSNYVHLANVLPEMTGESRLYVGKWAPYTLVTVQEEMPYLIIETTDTGFNIKSNVDVMEVDKEVIIVSRGASSINYINMTSELRPFFSQLLSLERFPLEAEDALKDFLEGLRGKVEVHSELIKGGSTLETVKGTSTITLQMRPNGKEAYMVSIFCRPLAGGRAQCEPGEGNSIIFDVQGDHRVCVERELDKERELYYDLVNGVEDVTVPPEKTFEVDAFDLLSILDYVREHNEGYSIEWPEGQKLKIRNYSTSTQWSAAIKKNKNGWFEMEGDVQLDDDTKISVAKLLDLIGQSKNRFIRLDEGEFFALSDRLRSQLNTIDALASRSRGKLQMSKFSAALLDSSIVDGEMHIDVDPELKQVRQNIIDSSEYSPKTPRTLKAKLRDYQKEGYQWIARLNSWGAGALLADDMGLGKTVQTIAYLLFKAKEGPSIVIAPASVAPNWKTEFDKFAPSLNVEILNFAENRSTAIADAKAGDVIITTYGLLLHVKDAVIQKEWTTAVLDEAHVIKNRGAKTSALCMQLKTKYRIMLTGTPVQNHLGELWNLFQFVNPGLLGSYEDFSRRFITPIELGGDKESQKRLDKLVHPFMLRRTKDNVLNELPEKTEIYQTVELSKEEMAVYELIREKAEAMLNAESSDKISMNTLAEITRLRQASCSAKLVEPNWKGKSSKVDALIEALEPIVESGDFALVFSQFTSFLSIVKKALTKAKIPYLYIDGAVSVKERQKLVEKYQNGECPVFIISLKAGGLGLNLTRANYVFHLDPWWNPAIEAQATDRAHRMGQHNAVTVYHLLSAGTIEEKIKRMHEQKKDLAENVLDGTDISSKLTGKELLEMIR